MKNLEPQVLRAQGILICIKFSTQKVSLAHKHHQIFSIVSKTKFQIIDFKN